MRIRSFNVTIVADTRQLRRELARTELLVTRSRWRRLVLRFRIWQIKRERSPR